MRPWPTIFTAVALIAFQAQLGHSFDTKLADARATCSAMVESTPSLGSGPARETGYGTREALRRIVESARTMRVQLIDSLNLSYPDLGQRGLNPTFPLSAATLQSAAVRFGIL